MNTGHFLAQDQEGNCYRVLFEREPEHGKASQARAPAFSLEDGSAVRRLDNETFQVVPTGALVSLVRN
jgi:hypothetical protein